MAMLRTAGYAALAASSGAEALALLEKQAVDLVMLDLVMPVMDGREVVQRIRAIPHYRTLPILVITSEAEQSDLAGIKADASCAVMAKPILPLVLLGQVQRRIG